MHILVQKASWRIDEAPRALHNKKQRSSSSSTWQEREKFVNFAQQEKEKLHKLCTTRNNNKKAS
jgi:hypothetical protein